MMYWQIEISQEGLLLHKLKLLIRNKRKKLKKSYFIENFSKLIECVLGPEIKTNDLFAEFLLCIEVGHLSDISTKIVAS